MTDAEIMDLELYARSIGLPRTVIGTLVVQRELRKPQLKRKARGRSATRSKAGLRRVTIHVVNLPVKTAFTKHAKVLGFGSGEAALELYRIELKNRWLFNMFGFLGNQE